MLAGGVELERVTDDLGREVEGGGREGCRATEGAGERETS